jgi:hypothetical protein
VAFLGAYVRRQRHGSPAAAPPVDLQKASVPAFVSLAYSIDPNTVIRAGYGIYFHPRVGGFAENDSQGFFSSFTHPTPASVQTPVVVVRRSPPYPGNEPPFIDSTVMNGQGNALFIVEGGPPRHHPKLT